MYRVDGEIYIAKCLARSMLVQCCIERAPSTPAHKCIRLLIHNKIMIPIKYTNILQF